MQARQLAGAEEARRLDLTGCARLHCAACGHDLFVPFSCKSRGICPSCQGRRMGELAATLVDTLLPEAGAKHRRWCGSEGGAKHPRRAPPGGRWRPGRVVPSTAGGPGGRGGRAGRSAETGRRERPQGLAAAAAGVQASSLSGARSRRTSSRSTARPAARVEAIRSSLATTKSLWPW
ncbi:MAG: transposase zinc-binding domain-containing protein [Proteobacteria bacterium]|nr:transposase zinc-binding domain-containing protein [Pseudomonadota bacterium]